MSRKLLIAIGPVISKKRSLCYIHFNGFYKGNKIKRIEVSDHDGQLKVNEEYLFFLKEEMIKGTSLICTLKNYKAINDHVLL